MTQRAAAGAEQGPDAERGVPWPTSSPLTTSWKPRGRKKRPCAAGKKPWRCAGWFSARAAPSSAKNAGPRSNREPGEKTERPKLPYKFCEACEDEYLDYIERLQGRGDPDCYWHNDAWLDSWRKWIDYQGSVDHYVKSKEFLRLLQEFKQSSPDT